MSLALFLSPHLDDVAFSCGATLLRLVQNGFDPLLVTVFTRSVPNPQGFALRCQTDKGIAPEEDYMALRRDEDREFARILGVRHAQHWEFEEAPHRGYESPAELFAGVKDGDEIWRPIAERLRALDAELGCPPFLFAPQGLGNHVDHLHVIRAVLEAGMGERVRWYRDTPYAIREPNAQPSEMLPPRLIVEAVPFEDDALEIKIAGCCAYASQIGFQFGGPDEVRRKLTMFHCAEATAAGSGEFAERFLTGHDARELG